MPQTKEFYVVRFDERDGIEVVEFFFCETESTEVINLSVYFLHHLGSEYDTFVPAFEKIYAVEIGVFMEDHAIHIKFVKVCVG
jgi:hypothetical protein